MKIVPSILELQEASSTEHQFSNSAAGEASFFIVVITVGFFLVLLASNVLEDSMAFSDVEFCIGCVSQKPPGESTESITIKNNQCLHSYYRTVIAYVINICLF